MAAHQQTVVLSNDLSGIRPPNFNWDSHDLPQEFKNFQRYCKLLLTTPTYKGRENCEKVNYILLWMGPAGVDIFDNWSHLTADDKKDPDKVWDAFEQYFEPKSNYRLARFQLRDMKQRDSESIDSFITRLRAQAQKCNFTTGTEDDNLIDQLIKGVAHDEVRKRLLSQDPKDLTMDKCVDYARTFEATATQLQQLAGTATVAAVRQKQPPRHPRNYGNQQKPSSRQATQGKAKKCFFCGGEPHKRDECPAKDQMCNKCHNKGHWGNFAKTPGKLTTAVTIMTIVIKPRSTRNEAKQSTL